MKKARRRIVKIQYQITVQDIVDLLKEDGMLLDLSIAKLSKMPIDVSEHPLIQIQKSNIPNPENPKKMMSLDELSRWFAEKTGLEFFSINPMA